MLQIRYYVVDILIQRHPPPQIGEKWTKRFLERYPEY
jgi:hypothetical protein